MLVTDKFTVNLHNSNCIPWAFKRDSHLAVVLWVSWNILGFTCGIISQRELRNNSCTVHICIALLLYIRKALNVVTCPFYYSFDVLHVVFFIRCRYIREMTDKMSMQRRRLYIGGLFHGATCDDVKERFGKFGDISNVSVKTKQDGNGKNL